MSARRLRIFSSPFRPSLISVGLGILITLFLVACQTEVMRTPAPTAYPVASAPPLASPVPTIGTSASPSAASVSGIVVDSAGAPISRATVRVQATTNRTETDEAGRFVLGGLQNSKQVTVTAWKDAYYCDKVETVMPPAAGVKLVLREIQTNDNAEYEWIPPTGSNSCYSCKPGVTQVWLDNDAHGKSGGNVRFLTMFYGKDTRGNQSPLTRYAYTRDYGRLPLGPDWTKPYYGPGYKLDFPDTAGNCAACHIPGAAVDDPYGVDPSSVSGVNAMGIHCDYCHKVADVKLDPTTGLPHPNMPGVLSQDIRRPFPEDKDRYQLFFGSFDDDNVPMEDTYLPLIKESQWCAPCHYGVFWDTVVYNSFGEWLSSPYSNPATGKTCQQCHMPAPTMLEGQALANVAPTAGGVERDPQTIPAHTFPGASSPELLQNAVTMTASASQEGDELLVKVGIVNDKTGHHVPTDSPLRQMILLVTATDRHGNALPQLDGAVVPEWGGVGEPTEGNYAGLPGKGYAKILVELWTEITPTGAYWNPTRIASDNRLAAFEADTNEYHFALPSGASARVQATLYFRRAFKSLMDQKGWDVPDIVMAQQILTVP
jgi:Carboxypeptidase regulatory-like domain